MPTNNDHLVLAGEFPQPTPDKWLALVQRVLFRDRDASPEELATAFRQQLVTRTLDGLEVQPLYTAGDAPDGRQVGFPGCPPFTRGARPAGGWDVRSRVDVGADGVEAGRRAVEELESGASSILLGLRTVPMVDIELLDRATADVYLDLAPVVLDAGVRFASAADALFALWGRREVREDEARAVLGADPVGEYARTGGGVDLARGLERPSPWPDSARRPIPVSGPSSSTARFTTRPVPPTPRNWLSPSPRASHTSGS